MKYYSLVRMKMGILEKVTEAIEIEMDRDFQAWFDRWTYPGGCYIDAPDPPLSKYTTSPLKIARAAIEVYELHVQEISK